MSKMRQYFTHLIKFYQNLRVNWKLIKIEREVGRGYVFLIGFIELQKFLPITVTYKSFTLFYIVSARRSHHALVICNFRLQVVRTHNWRVGFYVPWKVFPVLGKGISDENPTRT